MCEMEKDKIKKMISDLETTKKELYTVREKLREMESEISDLISVSEDAYESLLYATDRLSELV